MTISKSCILRNYKKWKVKKVKDRKTNNKKRINKLMKIAAILALMLCISCESMSIRAEKDISDLHAPKSTSNFTKSKSIPNAVKYDARIGNVYYKTLNEAFDIAGRNDIIYLQRDVELMMFIDLYTDLNLTLASEPGEHYKITRSSEFTSFNNGNYLYDFLFHMNCNSFTISNVTIDGGAVWDENGSNLGIACNSQLIVLYYGTLTLNNVFLQNNDNTADTPSESYASAVSTDIETRLIMNGGSIQNNRTAGFGGAVASKESSLIMNNVSIINNRAAVGGAFYLWGGSINLTDSKISKNSLTDIKGLGGGIYSFDADIIISNCQISQNTALHGGGIFFIGGSCEIDGSSLEDNNASGDGGAIHSTGLAGKGGLFLINNSCITGNYAKRFGGAVYHDYPSNLELSGDIKIIGNGGKNIYLKNPSYSVIVKNTFTASDRIGILVDESAFRLHDVVVRGNSTLNGTEIISNDVTVPLLENFYSESSTYILKESEKNLILENPQTTYEARIDSTYYDTLFSAISDVKDGEEIYLLKDVVRGGYCYYSRIKSYTLRSEPGALYQIKRDDDLVDDFLFMITYGAAVTFKDIIIDGAAIWSEEGSRSNDNSGLKVKKPLIQVEGTFYLETGAVIRNNHVYCNEFPEYDGSGIIIISRGQCYINGGEITQNAITALWGYGAGIKNDRGKLTVNGGRITKNSIHSQISNGGGISNSSAFSINGGIISDNISAYAGGVYSYSAFTMTDGRIIRNTSTDPEKGGGGLYINEFSFTMKGGEISENSSESYGGGIYSNSGAVILQGGTIENNYAKESGGGIYIEGYTANVKITGGRIIKNKAEKNGGGIYVTSSKINFINGEINYNQAGIGGGIYSNKCTLDYKDVEIKYNEATAGSGIALYDCDLRLSQNINIYNNKHDDIFLLTSARSIKLKDAVTFANPLKVSLGIGFKQNDIVVNGLDKFIIPVLENYKYAGDDFSFKKLGYNIILAEAERESDIEEDLEVEIESETELETDEKTKGEEDNNDLDNEEVKEESDLKENLEVEEDLKTEEETEEEDENGLDQEEPEKETDSKEDLEVKEEIEQEEIEQEKEIEQEIEPEENGSDEEDDDELNQEELEEETESKEDLEVGGESDSEEDVDEKDDDGTDQEETEKETGSDEEIEVEEEIKAEENGSDKEDDNELDQEELEEETDHNNENLEEESESNTDEEVNETEDNNDFDYEGSESIDEKEGSTEIKKDTEENPIPDGGTGSSGGTEPEDNDNGSGGDKISSDEIYTGKMDETDQEIASENGLDSERDAVQHGENKLDEDDSPLETDDLFIVEDDIDLSECNVNKDESSKDLNDIVQTGYHDFYYLYPILGMTGVFILSMCYWVLQRRNGANKEDEGKNT